MKKLLSLIFLIAFLLFPQKSFAEVIHSFDTQITAHKNGEMDIAETINYDFENEYRHGIYRYIPIFSKVGNLYRIIEIKNVNIQRDGNSEMFKTQKNKEQIYFKIGNPDKTINGAHIYKISYTVLNGIGSNFKDHDEIYWNVTGNDWQVDIQKASATVLTDFDTKQTNIICFSGSFGSTEKNCQVGKNSISTTNLYAGQGLTLVAVYPPNTFPKSILSTSPPQTLSEKALKLIIKNYLLIFFALNAIIPIVLIYWYQKHKNKKRFGKPAVNFDIPKDENKNIIRPALAGTIDTSVLERDDIVATIFDLAIRKYIKLTGEKTVKSLAPDTTKQIITKLKEPDAKLNFYEKQLMDYLFEDGDTVDVSTLKTTFYKEYSDMEKKVFETLVEEKYFTKNPKNQKIFLVTLAWLSLLSGGFILFLVLYFLSFKLNGRTSLGDEIDFKIDGLKIFLKSMDRNYKWQAKNFYTVEQMIPYAMALGYIEKFMENLKGNYPDYKPSWYVGYSGGFYASYGGFYSSMTTTVAPSSSSGAGGGGFSGGGGGGGGGGSW